MNIKNFIEVIIKECDFLFKNEYIYSQTEANIRFEKHLEKEGFRISFSWSEYGDNFHVHALGAKKRFNSVEEKIKTALKRNIDLEQYYTINVNPDVKYIPEGLTYSTTENNIHFEIKTEEELRAYLKFVKAFYINQVIPFFEEYKTIEKVNSQLKELLDNKKIQSLLTSSGNTTIVRFYIIALICFNQEIISFFDNTYFPYLVEQTDSISKQEELWLLTAKNELNSWN